MAVDVILKPLPHFSGLRMPVYESDAAAGVDLRAALREDEPITLKPGERVLVPTGLAMELPDNCEAQIRPRSGLAINNGITALNSPGTIDADYRGEVKIILINHGQETFVIERGMRIVQMVIAPIVQARFHVSNELSETKRGTGGFGSTGV